MGNACGGERAPDAKATVTTASAKQEGNGVVASKTSASSADSSKKTSSSASTSKSSNGKSKSSDGGNSKSGVGRPVPGESAQMKRLRELFSRYDTDKNGEIDAEELEKLLRELYNPSRREIEEFVKRFDLNGDGELSFDEYKQGIMRVNPDYAKPENEDLIQDKFASFDTNGDGKLSGKELEEVARDTLAINPNMRKRAMMLFDKDRSKTVTFEEFVETIDRLRGNLSIIWKSHRDTNKK